MTLESKDQREVVVECKGISSKVMDVCVCVGGGGGSVGNVKQK